MPRHLARFSALILFVSVSSVGAAQSIDTLNLRKHIRFLASDALGGRANGSPGQQAAAEYLVAELDRLGLRPLGDDFKLTVPMGAVDIDSSTKLLLLNDGRDTVLARDFFHVAGDSLSFLPFAARAVHSGPLRVTYHPDSVRGAVIIAEPSPTVTLDSASAVLQRLGATALLIVHPDSARFADLKVAARGVTRFFLKRRPSSVAERRMPVLLVHPRVGAVVRGAKSVSVRLNPRFRDVSASNVAAVVPGRDPSRASRHLVFTAHYDHVGMGVPIGGDSIYNGFIDNAVGVAALLEIARVVKANPLPESVVFLFLTMEEEGSLGSSYFVANSPVPVNQYVAAVNIDAVVPLAPPRDWYVEATEHASIRRATDSLSRARGEQIRVEPLKANSDHWPFHVAGVPAVFPVPGDRWGNWTDAQMTQATTRWWRHHRVTDHWSPDFPLSGLASWSLFALDLGRAIATARRD